MEIKVIECKGKDLEAGDLFSPADSQYWSNYKVKKSIGEKVYIRTDTPLDDDDLEDREVVLYKIIIEK